MAEYLTNTTDLTAVANAIRSKGGTTDPLVYPDGFVTAINSIQASSGGVDIKVNKLTPDCYLCNKDDQTAYLNLSNAITGKYFSFVIMLSGTIFDPRYPDDEYNDSSCLICGVYTGDDSDTSPDSVTMKSISINSTGMYTHMPMRYDPTTKRIDVSFFFEISKNDGMPSVIDRIDNSYVINWN